MKNIRFIIGMMTLLSLEGIKAMTTVAVMLFGLTALAALFVLIAGSI